MNYLILVRHGQSTYNLENRFTGWKDVDLTSKGIIDAQNAAHLLKNESFDIFSKVSPPPPHPSGWGC